MKTATSIVYLATAACTLAAAAAEAQCDAAPPLSASLLRRLASTADAFRTDSAIYIVASEEAPHEVLGTFAACDSAKAVLREAGTGFHTYGPFITPRDEGTLPLVVLPCWKDDITTRWECPYTIEGQSPVVPFSDADSVRLTIYSHTRGPLRLTLPQPPSAFVLTFDAFDRFIVPYYTRLFGPAFVAQMRQDLIEYVQGGLAGQ